MVYKYGRYGKFLACPGYPECKNTKPIVETIDVPCPKCGGTIQVRKAKRKKNIIFVKIIQNHVTIYLGINQKWETLGIQRRRRKLQREQLEKEDSYKKDSKKKATTKKKKIKK